MELSSEEIRLRDSQSTPVSHTPGPWEVGDNGVCTDLMVYCNDALGSRVANCSDSGHGITNEQDKANARLIAAAPDLLAVARSAESFCAQRQGGGLIAEQLRSVIAKAEGRS